jgi:hypothetical protein
MSDQNDTSFLIGRILWDQTAPFVTNFVGPLLNNLLEPI